MSTGSKSKGGRLARTAAPVEAHIAGGSSTVFSDFQDALQAHVSAGVKEAEGGAGLTARQQLLLSDVMQHFTAQITAAMTKTLEEKPLKDVAAPSDVEPLDRDLANAVVAMRAQAEKLAKDISTERKETRLTLPVELKKRYETRAQKAKAAATAVTDGITHAMKHKTADPSPALITGLKVSREVMEEVALSYDDQNKKIDAVTRDAKDAIAVADAVSRVGPATKRMDRLMASAPTAVARRP